MYRVSHHTFAELYWAAVRQRAGCWGWVGQQHHEGYGILRNGKSRMYAARFAYELFVGSIPPGMVLDHLCGQRSCTNPQHLEAVSNAENTRRVQWTSSDRDQYRATFTPHVLLPVSKPTPSPFPNVDNRFWARITKTPTCWEWTGGTTTAGYGLIQFDGQKWYTHRLAYTILVGPIPEGLTIDHLCRNRRCTNPEHMELVSRAENGRRANQKHHPR